uniref:Uncharacterized protein n=1 Tax=Chromera velia CCMP2878 TaxID=1169474 RepID=A0A0G4FQM9_9ALVE|eukprot:Cvel_18115.t1-p1 / transcript=Cvel_18115.t1 / gene=Cvel_18115 / organism=Chromera_velia_CCMP2878 / gene_product=hypothetical protein / transcript_product=hypothetical protein / location=Cvel_scaffold1486:659-4419(+) / protein_length=168 / sequence_SO=supercontig / SO=protein_coding / is_pseudo=false
MATPVQTRGDGGKEKKGSRHMVVIPSRVPPSRRSGRGDTETRALGAEGVVVGESVVMVITVDDLESGRSIGAMKREKCPRHVARRTIRKGVVYHILRLQTRSSPVPVRGSSLSPSAADFVIRHKAEIAQAKELLEQARETVACYYDRHRRELEVGPGDWVLVHREFFE